MSQEVDESLLRKAKDVAAGFAGGAVQVLIGQPFDLVKVRLQTGQYNSPLTAVRDTLKNEGLLAFYKGTLAPLFGVGACVSLQFYGFHEAKRQLLKYNSGNSGTLSLPQFYAAGAVAGIVNTPITAPVEQLRIILQTQKGKSGYHGPRELVKHIVREYGVSALGRGFQITLLREIQAYGVWFLAYEWLMKTTTQKWGVARDQISTPQLMLYGALAGEFLWLSSYPLDVIKSRVQGDTFGSTSKYHGSARAAARHIWQTQGLIGFWRGIVPTLVRAIPCSAATFTTVEWTLRLLGS
ncbi:BA75_03963T0 [Komagataella pastoris]|uniref:BA75_03963T0 n=1 Tax=Komagataella pastoris TaxID=4922 RepID=A0A1B2JFJ1_PICPA|nr:BA75_03963T0 [Komagataella pastoris]